MKKFIALVVSVAIATVSLNAKPTGLNLGGGIGMSNFPGIDVNEVTTSFGPYLEAGYDIPLGKSCLIYTGIRYNEKFGSGNFENTTENTFMGEITVPVKFQLVFNPLSRTKFYLEAGPSLDIVTSWKCKLKSKETGEVGWIDMMDVLECNMVNALIGGNFGVKFNEHIKLSVGADYALFKVSKANDDIKKWQANIGVAYIF